MSDIFISYRREDGGWAGRLAEILEEDFAVFFDTESIDYGDQFPDRIEEALQGCRIFFAVIGPEWVKAKNLRRLKDDKDWVQQEIYTALQSKNVRVIPVLVGRAKRPSSDDLPEPLKPLLERNDYQLSPEKWKNDCKELARRIEKWLSGLPAQIFARSNAPPILPYLCDRIDQQEDLVDFLQKETPIPNCFVVILPGHKWESHDGFLQRLQYHNVLDKLLKSPEAGIAFCRLQWNRTKAKGGQYGEVLKGAIRWNVMQVLTATDEEIREFFLTLRRPHVLELQITWGDYSECGKPLFPGLIGAWKAMFTGFGQASDGGTTGPPHPVVLWVNQSFDEPSQALARDDFFLAGELGVGLLSELNAITQGHIDDWMGQKEVAPFVSRDARVKGQILALTEDDERCCGKGQLHMLKFAEAVQSMLNATP